METDLKTIVQKYIDDFLAKQKDPELSRVIVKDSIPIVWFGNIDKYFNSNRRIVTVAINPSKDEFSEKRFDIVDLQNGTTANSILHLKKTLCQYFEDNPYSWFSRPEFVLNALGATYYSYPRKRKNDNKKDNYDTAIHIDAYSAIATDPTWGGLTPHQKEKLQNIELFKELLNYLQPDMILISTNRDVFNSVFGDYRLIGEKYQNEGNVSRFYIRKYQKDDRVLFWVFNNQGSAFGCRYDFMKESIVALMK